MVMLLWHERFDADASRTMTCMDVDERLFFIVQYEAIHTRRSVHERIHYAKNRPATFSSFFRRKPIEHAAAR